VLPLVCRAFRGLLAGPNAVLWPDLEFHADISIPSGVQRARSFLAWLAAHGSLMRTLHVSCWVEALLFWPCTAALTGALC